MFNSAEAGSHVLQIAITGSPPVDECLLDTSLLTLFFFHFPPQSSFAAVQDGEDGLGSSSSAGHSTGKLHLRVRGGGKASLGCFSVKS